MQRTLAYAYGQRTLKLGSKGSDVTQLQGYLTDVGLQTPRDGVFGPTTSRKVKAFERNQGQRQDGKVTPAEARQIQQAAAEGADQSAGNGGTLAQDSAGTTASAGNPTARAQLSSDGRTAIAPDSAPQTVKDAIAAANAITDKPYLYGGGHGDWNSPGGYDCSGSVSYALHGAGLLSKPMDSTEFESWGTSGKGQWITFYANPEHAFVIIAGLRFDTSGGGQGESGPRWRTQSRSTSGYTERHPTGW